MKTKWVKRAGLWCRTETESFTKMGKTEYKQKVTFYPTHGDALQATNPVVV